MQQTSSQYFTTIKILHLALVAGQILFAGVSFFIITTDGRGLQPGLEGIFNIVVPLITLAGIGASMALFIARVKQARSETAFNRKMATYRSALIMRYALLEGPSLFAIVAYLLSGQVLYLAAPAVLIGLMLMQRPSKTNAVNDLELDYNEQMKLDNADDFV